MLTLPIRLALPAVRAILVYVKARKKNLLLCNERWFGKTGTRNISLLTKE